MLIRTCLFVFFLCTACHSGILPCPKIKTAKIKHTSAHKHFFAEPSSSLSADAGETEKTSKGRSKSSDTKFVNNVSEEEWDCPHPGKRKYMPKRVKENIRRNLEKLNSSNE